MNLYWTDKAGKVYEYEADTKAHVYGWFRDLNTDESIRLLWNTLNPIADAKVLALAASALA